MIHAFNCISSIKFELIIYLRRLSSEVQPASGRADRLASFPTPNVSRREIVRGPTVSVGEQWRGNAYEIPLGVYSSALASKGDSSPC